MTPKQTELANRLESILYHDLVNILKDVNGGRGYGFNPQVRFDPPRKRNIANWMVLQHCDKLDAIEARLPVYEDKAKEYNANKPNTPANASRPAARFARPSQATPSVQVENVPMPGGPRPMTQAELDAAGGAITPNPAPITPRREPDAMTQAIIHALEDAGWKPQGNAPTVDMAAVMREVNAAIERAKLPRVTHITVSTPATPTPVNMGLQHKLFPDLLRLCAG